MLWSKDAITIKDSVGVETLRELVRQFIEAVSRIDTPELRKQWKTGKIGSDISYGWFKEEE